jgi:transcriptional enhancer factor
MEHRRHILPSQSYPPYQLSLDDVNGLSSRQPLSDAASNGQLQELASASIYHERKSHQPRAERSMYSMPTLPSQPVRPPVVNSLEARHQGTRRRRHMKYSRNPIVDSPQYQAYRARQSREGNAEDAKWPLPLEMAFLDGTCPSRGFYFID